MTALVAVVGSANLDIVLSVAQRPAAGETVMGTAFVETTGGKGANQALAAARIGPTTFIGSVGPDAAGRSIEEALFSAGVRVDHLQHANVPTGRAYVTLTADGENSIIVMALANSALNVESVLAALEASGPTLVLTQFEVPEAVTAAVVRWCRSRGARLVLNPSPVKPGAKLDAANADPLIVNQIEARAILGSDLRSESDLALALAEQFASVILTAGSRGAFVARGSTVEHVGAENVAAVDNTGAGDSFAGTLSAHLAQGEGLLAAARRASAEAARIIQLHRSER